MSKKPGGNSIDNLTALFLTHLLRPREWNAQQDGGGIFSFRKEHIISLCEACLDVLANQPMIIHVQAPIKVFGDIHGQYQDLMRFFDLWESPSEDGDIESYDYLFLGDFVDRGNHSLETICLLMALKVKYPEKLHMLRGNHEDRWINQAFGFAEECANRLGEDPSDPDSVFNRINDLFDWLPLAAVIDDKIMCLHGGIGSTLTSFK
jgi:protein phosphatase